MRCAGFRRIALLPAVLLLLIAFCVAQAPVDRPLTNLDVVKLVDAGIPESIIVRKIQVSETNFVTTPDDLISLKHRHVPDGVLEAMVDSQGSARTLQVGPPSVPYAVGQTAVPHPHKLPNIDAAVRINPKTTEKIAIRANQIKVEQSGKTLFSVTWKGTQSK